MKKCLAMQFSINLLSTASRLCFLMTLRTSCSVLVKFSETTLAFLEFFLFPETAVEFRVSSCLTSTGLLADLIETSLFPLGSGLIDLEGLLVFSPGLELVLLFLLEESKI